MMQTPYLKIYLLRCDDKDAYKAESRQLLRDWVRENSAPTQTSSSKPNTTENHDACDWLILHVVIPDTVAASEPRWTAASSKDPDELVERPQSTAVWPGKSTRTVLDKIRADFTIPTKSTVEKVAQLRLQKKDFPPQYLPKSPVPTIYTETAQEQDVAWQDLVAKFKTLILMSFDLRVTQYEEDIREKDSQRSLPGWNFCTFFTLKEGLARGFESVGLVEDALAIYDELSAGLDNAVHDDPQATFLGDMKVSRESLRCVLESAPDADKVDERAQDLFSKPLDLTKKDYRGEIVKNTISLFDFRVYIFARQRTLLLRLGAGTAPAQQKRPQTGQGNKDDNLNFPAEVCRRTAAFAATNSRSLRRGLQTGYEHSLHIFRSDSCVDSSVGLKSKLLPHLTFLLKMLPRPGPMPFSNKYLQRQLPKSCLCLKILAMPLPRGSRKHLMETLGPKTQTPSILAKERILIRTDRLLWDSGVLLDLPTLLNPLKSFSRTPVSAKRAFRPTLQPHTQYQEMQVSPRVEPSFS